MIHHDQKGFSLIEGLLIVIAVTLVAFVGYYVWHSQNQTDRTLNTAAKASNAANNSRISASKTTSKYLNLIELGVKIPLNDKISDAEYELAPDGETIGLSTKHFEEAVADCKSPDTASASFPTVVTVNKVSGTYNTKNPPFNAYSSFAVQLSGFYLESGTVDGGYCNGSDQAKNQTVKNMYNQVAPLLNKAVHAAQQT